MPEMLKFEMPKNQSSIIKVIGVGGGGSNAVTHMFKQGIRGVDFIICNTDCQALDTSPVPVKIQLGKKGLGAGSIPQVGRDSANENIDQFRKLLENNTRMVFITAGMGGGTGTGAAPVIASLARELGILTVGIVTIPFSFEGRKRAQQARAGIDELRKSVDTLLIICNDKLRELEGDLKLSEAFNKADNILTVAAKGIAEIITVTGYINVDFEDVKTVMKESGKAIMGSGVASGENRALEAVQMAMTSPLLDDANIKGASNILLYIASGNAEITLDEVMEITDYIQNEAGSSADIIWGNGNDDSLGDKISLTLIATGFDSKNKNQEDTEKIIHVLNENKLKTETPKQIDPIPEIDEVHLITKVEEIQSEPVFINRSDATEKKEDQRVFTFEFDNSIKAFNPTPKPPEQVTVTEKKSQPGFDFLKTFRNDSKDLEAKQEELMKDRAQKLEEMSLKIKTAEGLAELEKQPAYLRRKVELHDPSPSSETEVSRYTLIKNENGVEMKQNNSFLHDNVD
jgi:cell division protein FtsZ